MLDKLKNLYQLQQQASQLKSQLDSEFVETDFSGIKIVMNGNLEIKSLTIEKNIPAENLAEIIKSAINAAIKNTQQKVARKLSSTLNLPI